MTQTHDGNADIHIASTPEELARQGATLFCEAARNSVARHGRFTVAISGGSTPRAMHRLLAKKPYIAEIPWRDTHIFWVDERMVPEDHAASNYGTAKNDFLTRVPLPLSHIYPMPHAGPPSLAAARYRDSLKRVFSDANLAYPEFDLIFLGMGTDGHTASLFPDHPEAEAASDWVLALRGGSPNVDRLTLSYPVLNRAERIVFLVAGIGKAEMIRTVFTEPDQRLPAQRIMPSGKNPLWLLDANAASLLSPATGES